MEWLPLLEGLFSYAEALLPAGLFNVVHARQRKVRSGCYWGAGATADYPYGVWLKHLTLLAAHGLKRVPGAVVEFGPGSSLGVGIAALLSGAERYHALDVGNYLARGRHPTLLAELTARLADRAPRPRPGWPDIDRYLGPGLFPVDLLTPTLLEGSLEPARVARIAAAVDGIDAADGRAAGEPDWQPLIEPIWPWQGERLERLAPVDLILSHSVLEYVPDVADLFEACWSLLAPGGWMSHQVDLTSLELTRRWNGHWAYPDWAWRRVVGARRFPPRRRFASAYVDRIRERGFELVATLYQERNGGIGRDQLAAGLGHASDRDLRCSGLFVIARKPA